MKRENYPESMYIESMLCILLLEYILWPCAFLFSSVRQYYSKSYIESQKNFLFFSNFIYVILYQTCFYLFHFLYNYFIHVYIKCKVLDKYMTIIFKNILYHKRECGIIYFFSSFISI